ncbi:hypothetical protein AVEN_198330-1 [Araneus ventricosus]|uniref:Uncharacterized protein n=1 Tax=Araneus ventricosus TaxID=182803 RepID=A0A4Y2WX74_ARAVE|nr:hypothetical protein AVEN_198330-1 [Araneus ventricosus]
MCIGSIVLLMYQCERSLICETGVTSSTAGVLFLSRISAMQDKETVDDAEEALTCKTDIISQTPEKKEEKQKESTKDGKFAFRKMKTPKKGKNHAQLLIKTSNGFLICLQFVL